MGKRRLGQAMWLVLLLLLALLGGVQQAERKPVTEIEAITETEMETEETTTVTRMAGGAEARTETALVYDNYYEKEIFSEAEAREWIAEDAGLQSAACSNEEIADIERAMETDFGIFEVTLGEMDRDMAQKVYDACAYMFERYPVLYGKLTNFSIGNISSGAIAVSEYTDFVSPEDGIYPIVMKRQVILNAREFLNEERLTNLIRKSVAEGHWMEDTNIESIVVHELGHILLSEIRMERYNLVDFFYITEDNSEEFSAYNTDVLSMNQTTAREILEAAYRNCEYKDKMTMEEARGQISGYALGVQSDGGTSYEETIAEAMVDIYLHGEKADPFSLKIIEEMEQNWLFIPFPVSFVAKSTQNF